MRKINQEEMLEFITSFYNEHTQVPCIAFLANRYKVTMQAVRDNLADLADQKKVVLIIKNVRITNYKLKKYASSTNK